MTGPVSGLCAGVTTASGPCHPRGAPRVCARFGFGVRVPGPCVRMCASGRGGPGGRARPLGVGQDFSKFDPKFACARSARKSRKNCLSAGITDSESHPASTHPPASPCSHSRRRIVIARQRRNGSGERARDKANRERAGGGAARIRRARAPYQKETGGRAKYAQNLPGWIKICLTKICLRYIQNPGQRQLALPRACACPRGRTRTPAPQRGGRPAPRTPLRPSPSARVAASTRAASMRINKRP